MEKANRNEVCHRHEIPRTGGLEAEIGIRFQEQVILNQHSQGVLLVIIVRRISSLAISPVVIRGKMMLLVLLTLQCTGRVGVLGDQGQVIHLHALQLHYRVVKVSAS